MSHFIIEVPKEPPLKRCWIYMVAKNWILKDFLYTADNSYSLAYKQSLLVNGKDPDIQTWECNPSFKKQEQISHELRKAYQFSLLHLKLEEVIEKGLKKVENYLEKFQRLIKTVKKKMRV
ncbi:hypothetical protein OUZ56_018357 [Daphnia magna]|uniref:Uncharacterized protein n=1 Tax=Daphnia magna TaxID=35525 RepID=A0ABQ9Z8L5_9CRUS|nr:hypothetical protein OUZ56_018357 [Daphnia magna]